MDVMQRLANSIVVPVVVLDKAEDAIPTANAMMAGGIDVMEITFRTACAAEAIAYAVKNYPDMEIGAGTVINGAQCEAALNAGATFIVSPGFSPAVATICKEKNRAYRSFL